jgi:hypothetical protein
MEQGGYLFFKFNNKSVYNHRYLYERYYDVILKSYEFICHIDGNPKNNKIINLEKGNNRYNQQQQGANKMNKTGEKNVSILKNGIYRVMLRVDGKKKHFGRFENLQEAVTRRDQVIKELNEQGNAFITDYSDNKDRLPAEYCEKWHRW